MKERRIGIKVASFFMAFIVWLYTFIAREGILLFGLEETKIMDDVPVKVLERPGVPEVVWIKPEKVRLVVAGEARAVKGLGMRDLVAYVELSEELESGTYRLPVRVRLPGKVKVKAIVPQAVEVRVKGALTGGEMQ